MITIPEHIWEQMLVEFSREKRAVERVAYFDGVLFNSRTEQEDGVVTTLTIPSAQLKARRFEVSAVAMSEAGKHLRALKLVRLAQVHTHPEEWTGHSPWDDEKAYSQLPGAISIVLPSHAQKKPTLNDAGIHLRRRNNWEELPPREIKNYLRIIPSIYDFRKNQKSENEENQNGLCLKSSRKRSWWVFFAFWRNRQS